MQLVYSLNEIDDVAGKIIELAANRNIWAFYGEMGAGKTTLVHAVCNHLSVLSAFGSPTYSIINEYTTSNGLTIYHMDWYRLKNEEEALQAGVEDALYSGNVCLVEWPEKAEALLPDDVFKVKISLTADGRREVVVS